MQAERIVSIKKVRYLRSVDIEIDSREHIFYGNGIATSNSHSLAYSINTYSSSYAKIHFPTQFFCSYLRNAHEEQHPYEEIEELINEAKIFGIEIYTPNLKHLKARFHLASNKSIRFGIVDIRGIGEAQFTKIKELEGQSIAKYGKKLGELEWNQFLLLSNHLSKTVVENLILSGATDDN